MDTQTLSDLIGLVYDAARDVSQWPKLLQCLSDALDGVVAGPAPSKRVACEDLVALFVGHLGRARDMAGELTDRREECAVVEQLLDRLPLGMMVVDDHSRVLVCNDNMGALMAHDAPITTRDGMLAGRTAKDTLRLHDTVRAVAQGAEPSRTVTLSLPASELPLSALLVALGPGGMDAKVAVLVAAPEMHARIPVETLRSFYGLTRAEAKLVSSLLETRDLQATAERLDISKHTARNQLKSVFDKTGTHRQAELVRRVLTGPAMLSPSHRNPTGMGASPRPSAQDDGGEARLHQTMRLPDGRRLGFAEYGDPHGRPVMLMHSAAGSRLERHPDERIVRQCGIRLIIPDRPGIGLSEGERGGGFVSVARDVGVLARHLGLASVAVMGFSLGSAFALACAHELRERVTRLVLVSSIAPSDSAWELGGMYAPFRLLLSIGKIARPLVEPLVALTGRHATPDSFLAELLRSLPPADRLVVDDTAVRCRLLEIVKENFRQRSYFVLPEMVMAVRSWGFDLADIEAPTILWHGELDRIVPAAMARRLAERLRSSRTTFVPNAGHFLLFHAWRQILLSAISDEQRATAPSHSPNGSCEARLVPGR